jgi:hypothetical protein
MSKRYAAIERQYFASFAAARRPKIPTLRTQDVGNVVAGGNEKSVCYEFSSECNAVAG